MNKSVFGTSTSLCVGLGWIVGGIEALQIGFSLPWHFQTQELLILMVLALVCGLILSGTIGVIVSFFVSLDKYRHPTRSWSLAMTITGFFLSCWLILPLAFRVWGDDQKGIAIGVCATIVLFTFLIWQNSDFWLRRSFEKEKGRLRWWNLSLGTGILMVVIALVAATQKGYGSRRAIETDPDVVVLSIDGLGAKAVSSIAGQESIAQTPNIDSWANRCLRFDNAITPHSDVLPSQVSMITGIYPGQTGVIDNESPFLFQFDSMPEKLMEEGYATAGFVSHPALVKDSGFAQGFQLYDADRSPLLHGLLEINMVKYLLQALGRVPELRPAEETLAQASNWLDNYDKTPALTWIQVQIPDNLSKQEYTQRVSEIDVAIGDFLRKVRNRSVPRKLLLVITSAHGMHWKQGTGSHDGISDASVHVPLVICPVRGTEKAVVTEQVRTLDLLNTIYWQLKFSHVKESQSADIIQYIGQESFVGYQIFVMGRDVKSLMNGYVFGYRLKGKNSNAHYKYMWFSTRRQHALYNLAKDPDETNDISRTAETMIETLGNSTMKAAQIIKGLQLSEDDVQLKNIQPVQE